MLETKKVAQNTRSCQKVAEQLVESPRYVPPQRVWFLRRFSLRASSPIWASEANLERTCERAAKHVLARLAQVGENRCTEGINVFVSIPKVSEREY